ncbi:MAG: response regulator [Candidatus Omnitrophota bacterium]
MPRILVVDDEKTNVKLLEANLLPLGYEVITAYSGEEALEKVNIHPIDLILLDVMLHGIDGFEITKRLRSGENTRLIPIVLITALKETEDRIKGIEAGCDDFISKPFDKNEINARVKALLKISYYRSLLDEKEKFEYVIENIEDGIIVLDSAYNVARMNKKTRALLSLGTGAGQVNIIAHISKNFNVHYDGNLSADLKTKALIFDIERPETETVQSFIIEARSSIVKNPAGEISSILMIFHDVTIIRKEELMKQDFLGLVSHKLRTPASTINMSAIMLQNEKLEENQKKFIDRIVNQSFELNTLIESLLTFVTVNSRNLSSEREEINIHDYLPGVVDSLIRTIKDKKIDLNINCPDKDITINMNRIYFDLVIGSLVDNAIKFNDKDNIILGIKAAKIQDEIELSIADNGAGIPPEEQEKVFEKFYQVEKHFTGNVEGAGLGLALVKRIVTAYGGEIKLESEIGKGTKINFTIPS